MMTAADVEQARYAGNGNRPSYQAAKAMFPTPRAASKSGGGIGLDGGSGARKNPNYSPELGSGGSLNPDWVEWLMGWLIGWTDLKPLETDRFRQWRREHGEF
jgi:hypothetical protein